MKKTIIFVILIVVVSIVVYLQGNQNNNFFSHTKTLTAEDVRVELEALKKINEVPHNEKINPEDYPKTLGRYSDNGVMLIEQYFCSDICPTYGRINIVFQDIRSKEECAKIDGRDIIDLAWGGYIGCAPNID